MKKRDLKDLQTKDHYERWPFPGADFLSREGLLLMRYSDRWIRIEAKEKNYTVRVIDVGCGTGHTTIALANNFPEASFLGIDISKKSIEMARRQAEQLKLANITFQTQDLRKGLSQLGEFRIVLCLGVLHHIKDSGDVFCNIAHMVEPEGYLVLWLYGRMGRFHHIMNQAFVKLMTKNLRRDESFDVARYFLKDIGSKYAVRTGFYTPKGSDEEGIQWLLDHPAWLADQMIPAYENVVTIEDILRLFRKNRLEFWRWLGIPTHLRQYTDSERLLKSFERLSPKERLMAIDYLIKPSYYFVVGRKGKPD